MKIVFAGTPAFAHAALEQLHAAGHEIALVLTQPDRPAGRGMKLQTSPVKQFAQAHGIAVAQPRSLRLDGKYPADAAAAREAIDAAQADAMVVAAYGLILPQWVLDAMGAAGPPQGAQAPMGGSAAREAGSVGAMFAAGPPQGAQVPMGGSAAREASSVGAMFAAGPPQGAQAPTGGSAAREAGSVGAMFAAGPPQGAQAPTGGSAAREARSVGALGLGCFNIHASLLPRWRGAAPIHRAIEAGDTQTGITIMQMDAGLDTGDMLLVEPLAIGPDDTTARLHDRLAALGARLMVEALGLAACGGLRPALQPTEGVTYAHKIEKLEAVINWRQPAVVIAQRVRAFDPFPGAQAVLAGETIKLWVAQAHPAQTAENAENASAPGKVVAVDTSGIQVQTGEGLLCITELQRPGGKRLPVGEFLCGHRIEAGQAFETLAAQEQP
jgi:methionyl-tRNA formyltransferase